LIIFGPPCSREVASHVTLMMAPFVTSSADGQDQTRPKKTKRRFPLCPRRLTGDGSRHIGAAAARLPTAVNGVKKSQTLDHSVLS